MNKYPKLKFQINIDLDSEMAFQFMDIKAGGVDFGKGIVSLYPELHKAKETSANVRRDIIANFTDKYYEDHRGEIDKSLKTMRDRWSRNKKYFYLVVDRIFGKCEWPEGEYVCYLSIYNSNPRFLENKTFQIYFKHPQGTNHVIAHEMLHFMFFDYLKTNRTNFNLSLDENKNWLMSEWFNDLALELPEFRKFRQKGIDQYPDVVEFSKKFKRIDKTEFTIQKFLETIKTGL